MVKEDCFGYNEDSCLALKEMVCKHKTCPFYKRKWEVESYNEQESIEDKSVLTKKIIKSMTLDIQKGLSNKELAKKYGLSTKDVARKRYYILKQKG